MKSNLPDLNYFMRKELPGTPGNYVIVNHIGTGCNAHVFRARSENYRNDWACKIIPRKNLRQPPGDPTAWMDEAKKANTLSHSCVVRCQGGVEWKDPDPEMDIDCVALYFQYVRGRNLRDFIKANRKTLGLKFIEDTLRTIFELFHEMRERGMQHGDLHSGNVLVEESPEYQIRPKVSIRITDFGVGYVTSGKEIRDDYEQLALILKEMLDNVDYRELSARDRFAFDILNDHFLAKHLMEKDPTRDSLARNPLGLFERLERIDEEFTERERFSHKTKLSTPFDYLSCEQIGEDHSLLKSLYSNLFLGLSTIEARNNLVLTGPRGCGKSTVFKSLSLKHRVLVGEDDPENIGYVGVYYSCVDLYFSFPRYEKPPEKAAYDIPMHYITTTLLIGLLEAVGMWSTSRFRDKYEEKEQRLAELLWEVFGLPVPEGPGGNSIRAISEWLQRQRKRAAEKQPFAADPKHTFGRYFGPDVLPRACEVISNTLLYVKDLPFVFFIDDYSSPKITLPLQENLNRLLMQRSSSVFYKLSTESPVSYASHDIDGKNYIEKREFELLNLSLAFLHEEGISKALFIEDVFKRRFLSIPDYPVSNLAELVGSDSGRSYNDAAREIRNGKKPLLWGKEAVVDLCSGDIHYIINLVGKMVTSIGGRKILETTPDNPKISPMTQNKTIRDEAGNFLNNLRGLPRHGEKLSRIITTFGNLSHYYLMKFDSGNETARPPHQATRIEPYDELKLSTEALELYNELLRYSVFIEDPRGKSRRGKIVPRIYLRRFLIPHFNITFSKRDSIPLENNEIEELMLKPDNFYRKHIQKKEKDTGTMKLPFFPDKGEEQQ